MRRLGAILLLAGVSASVQAQTRDTIHVKVGDTTSMVFSLSDTVHFKKLPNFSFVATSCGAVTRYARDFPPSLKSARKADTTVYIADCPTTPPPAPTTVFDTSAKHAILSLLGPVIPLASEPSSVAFYEQQFTFWADSQWAQYGPAWNAGNTISEYERPATFYKQWALTGDTIWAHRAHALLVNWRDGYLIPAGYATSPHYDQPESLYLDWMVTHDTATRTAILQSANRLSAFPPTDYFTAVEGEGRIEARVITALWMAEKVTGQPNALLDTAIVKSLRSMNDSGFTAFQGFCGASINYMNGMLYDVLTRIHDQNVRPAYNALIEKNAVKFVTFLKASQWRGATDPSFNYYSVNCPLTDGNGGSPTSAPDLNGIMLPVIGWVGKFTGDPQWYALGDAALLGMQQASLYLYRQFSESFGSSYRYFGYRYPSSVIH